MKGSGCDFILRTRCICHSDRASVVCLHVKIRSRDISNSEHQLCPLNYEILFSRLRYEQQFWNYKRLLLQALANQIPTCWSAKLGTRPSLSWEASDPNDAYRSLRTIRDGDSSSPTGCVIKIRGRQSGVGCSPRNALSCSSSDNNPLREGN
jgi:hypothetical protein